MGLIDKLNKKQEQQKAEVEANMQEFLQLIRVYLQAVIASEPKLGVSNINMLPDLKIFKHTLKIASQGRLGMAEKSQAKKMLNFQYGLQDKFFSELDSSVRRICHKQQDIQSFFILFSNYTNDLLTVLTTTLSWKLRIPGFFKGLIRSTIKDGVKDIMTKTDWTAADTFQACARIRKSVEKLKYSEESMADFAFPLIMIAKGSKIKK